LEQDNKQLTADRGVQEGKLNDLRAAAKLAEQELPTPRFTMVQRIIGVEGTPLLPPLKVGGPGGPATGPARPDLLPPRDFKPVQIGPHP
jgi:hypothetical protein